jgi:hypothetical protein
VSRQKFRAADIKAALSAMVAAGMPPKSLDILPDGTLRWHFQEPAAPDPDTELDRELAEFEARHAQRLGKHAT